VLEACDTLLQVVATFHCFPRLLLTLISQQHIIVTVLRSANTADYIKRHTRTKVGERCFSHADLAAWNSLPDSIKLTTDINRFKTLLKTHLFHLAF